MYDWLRAWLLGLPAVKLPKSTCHHIVQTPHTSETTSLTVLRQLLQDAFDAWVLLSREVVPIHGRAKMTGTSKSPTPRVLVE